MEGLPGPAAAGAGHGLPGHRWGGTLTTQEAEPAVGSGPATGSPQAASDRWADRYAGQSVRLLLWRHGQTLWNAEGRFQGQTDISLDELGVQQAENAARRLAALRPTAIVSSDLGRAMSTAVPLARLTGLSVTPDKDLRERHGGAWEGLTDPEIRARYPAEHAAWQPPGGESTATVAERAGAALARIADSMNPGTLTVVVSHGAALRLGAAWLLGLPEDLWGMIGPLANCSWSVLGRRNERWRLIEHNAGTLPEPVLSDDRLAAKF